MIQLYMVQNMNEMVTFIIKKQIPVPFIYFIFSKIKCY